MVCQQFSELDHDADLAEFSKHFTEQNTEEPPNVIACDSGIQVPHLPQFTRFLEVSCFSGRAVMF